MNNSQKAYALGQAIWYDNIHRKLLQSGELAQMIAEGLIYGVTSNPSIFNIAIGKSNDYDEQLRKLAASGLTPVEIFDQLAISDIRAACDLFEGVYEASQGKDGYVSIEVDPQLADDTEATIVEARRLWDRVDRKNLMVKIPATKAGLNAIRTSIADGININITLIFSRARYREVIEAYVSGLDDRLREGKDIAQIASVASFFVSRIDSNVDDKLERIAAGGNALARDLMGKIAIANARMAYQDFRQVFSSERFDALRNQGARVQRPLWASTSTKNPNYPDTIYIDALMGAETVNTVPPETLKAFADNGTVMPQIELDLEGAQGDLERLEEIGVSLDTATSELEREGVEKFSQAYGEMMATVKARAEQVKAE